MVQIYSMDSDEEEAHQIQVLDDHDAYAVSTDHKSQGLRMTPKVPPQFDEQSPVPHPPPLPPPLPPLPPVAWTVLAYVTLSLL